MTLQIIQECDLCRTTRKISRFNEIHLEQGGWRKIPVLTGKGKEHDEQPVLCPDCQRKVWDYILMCQQGYSFSYKNPEKEPK